MKPKQFNFRRLLCKLISLNPVSAASCSTWSAPCGTRIINGTAAESFENSAERPAETKPSATSCEQTRLKDFLSCERMAGLDGNRVSIETRLFFGVACRSDGMVE